VNLLVTNTRNTQAYVIIRALRPYAQKIVVTMYGKNRLAARLSHAANSRLVDRRYYVPSPVEDWRAGRIQRENTEREEAYIQAVLRICEKEKIDTIFPSWDPKVYVFSKNKERFERAGVLIPVPDFETLITPLDKYRTIRAAQEVGFPCPKTYLPESENDLRRIADEMGFPLMIKPRFTSAGRGMEMVKDFSELSQKTRHVREGHGMPIIQEYIPGNRTQSFSFLLDKKGNVKVALGGKSHRHLFRIIQSLVTAREAIVPHPYTMHAARLAQRLGLWGGVNVQTKIDSRDGLPKLMEINPRLGYRLWERVELGINQPLMCLEIARGGEVEAVENCPVGTMLLDPIEDLLGLGFNILDLLTYKIRIGVLGKAPMDPSNPPTPLKELIQSYKDDYLNGKKKVFNPYFKYFFQDPLVSILWWFQFSALVLRGAKQLGR